MFCELRNESRQWYDEGRSHLKNKDTKNRKLIIIKMPFYIYVSGQNAHLIDTYYMHHIFDYLM